MNRDKDARLIQLILDQNRIIQEQYLAQTKPKSRAKNKLKVLIAISAIAIFSSAYIVTAANRAEMSAENNYLKASHKLELLRKKRQIHPAWLCNDGLTVTWNNRPVCDPV